MPTSREQELMLEFAKRLGKYRVRAGYPSAEQFAKAIGLHPYTYRKYERGDCKPGLDTLTRICKSLRVTPNDLMPEAAGTGFSARKGEWMNPSAADQA